MGPWEGPAADVRGTKRGIGVLVPDGSAAYKKSSPTMGPPHVVVSEVESTYL